MRPDRRRSIRRSRRRERGQGLVEFALIFPVFALLLFALIDIGRLVYINNAISEGAREGARWGAVQSRSMSAASRTTIGSHTVGSLAAVPAPAVTVTCTDVAGVTKTTCVSNNILTIRITTTVDLFTPVIGQILGPQTYTATARVAVSY